MTDRPGGAGAISARETALTSSFVELADSLVSDYDVIDVLDRLVTTCVTILHVSAAGVLLDDLSGGLAVAAASGEDMRTLEVYQSQALEGPCYDCVRSGEAVHSADLRTDDRWPRFAPLALDLDFISVSAVPLHLQGQQLGALGLFGRGVGAIETGDELLAQAFADVAAIGLLHQRNAHRNAVLAEQLRGALDSRVVIEQAKGVLAERKNLSIEQAYQRLRRHARHHNLKLTTVATRVLDGSLDLPR